jgi:hypothetical protein
MDQPLKEIRRGERFTVAIDAGSPLPAGRYRVLGSRPVAGDDVEYRVEAEDDGRVYTVRQTALRFFNKILR